MSLSVLQKKWLEHANYRYSCFISWHRSEGNVRLVQALQKAIAEDARRLGLPAGVFLDTEGLQPGMEWERMMESSLRSSILMVAICEPDYYESKWCGREYGGMEQLTKARRVPEPHTGIVPLVWVPAPAYEFRGLAQEEFLPPQINKTHCIDLTPLRLRGDFVSSKKFDVIVGQIVSEARRVAQCLITQRATVDSCKDWKLPRRSRFEGFVRNTVRHALTMTTSQKRKRS